MIEAAITWVGVLSALGVVCKTILECVKLYYRDKEKVRLEQLDRQLQLDSKLVKVDQDSVLRKIVELTNTKGYPYQIGEGVLDELKNNNLITSSRANYIMIGADNHRQRSKQ